MTRNQLKAMRATYVKTEVEDSETNNREKKSNSKKVFVRFIRETFLC